MTNRPAAFLVISKALEAICMASCDKKANQSLNVQCQDNSVKLYTQMNIIATALLTSLDLLLKQAD